MTMQLQTLFDSVCRCFGHPGGPNFDPHAHHGTEAGDRDHGGNSNDASNSNATDSRRRNLAQRLGLKDKEWDELFGDGKKGRRVRSSGDNTGHVTGMGNGDRVGSNRGKESAEAEAETEAEAVAQAKQAATPARQRHKRRRSSSDIFRKKKLSGQAGTSASSYRETIAQPTAFSRLLNPSLALCFATPVRDVNDDVDMDATQSIDNSDTNTLNTCEDTITSTVCFDAKYSHIVETRPPMPLFNQFKIGNEEDEIHHVIASDSHSSLRMIELLQQAQLEQQQHQRHMQMQQQRRLQQQQPHHLSSQQQQNQQLTQSRDGRPQPNYNYRGSSSDSEDLPPVLLNGSVGRTSSPTGAPPESKLASGGSGLENDEDAIPEVKAVSSSTDSSKNTVVSERTL